MKSHERNKRRAMIVRRQAARLEGRGGRVRDESWRRDVQVDEIEEAVAEDDPSDMLS